MLVYSPESPCDKENRAPRDTTNYFLGKRNVHNNLKPFIAPIHPTRILRTPFSGIRGTTAVMPSIEKDLLPVPKSIDFAVEGLEYGDFCRLNSTLASKHAWIISSPNSDPKSCGVSSLPHLNALGVSVDSPDINSKFYAKSPPLKNYSRDNDSPDVEASSLILNDISSIRITGLSGDFLPTYRIVVMLFSAIFNFTSHACHNFLYLRIPCISNTMNLRSKNSSTEENSFDRAIGTPSAF